MSRAKSAVVLLAAVIGVGGTVSTAYAQSEAQRREERKVEERSHRGYEQALKDLKQAREVLAKANDNWDGRRQQALVQTGYAIEQAYAALGDDSAKAKDQEVAARELEAGRDIRSEQGDTANIEQRRRQMNKALDHLSNARRELIDLPTDDPRRSKTITFTEQAIKDVQTAVAALK